MQRVRSYSIEILLTTALVAAVFFFGYLGYGLLRPEVINEPFSGERALTSAEKLVDFGPRITGTGASVEAGDWLIEQLRLLGWDIVIQPFCGQRRGVGPQHRRRTQSQQPARR